VGAVNEMETILWVIISSIISFFVGRYLKEINQFIKLIREKDKK
jgi:hypothetical protein